jgi:hypothetical protein
MSDLIKRAADKFLGVVDVDADCVAGSHCASPRRASAMGR